MHHPTIHFFHWDRVSRKTPRTRTYPFMHMYSPISFGGREFEFGRCHMWQIPSCSLAAIGNLSVLCLQDMHDFPMRMEKIPLAHLIACTWPYDLTLHPMGTHSDLLAAQLLIFLFSLLILSTPFDLHRFPGVLAVLGVRLWVKTSYFPKLTVSWGYTLHRNSFDIYN